VLLLLLLLLLLIPAWFLTPPTQVLRATAPANQESLELRHQFWWPRLEGG